MLLPFEMLGLELYEMGTCRISDFASPFLW